MDTNQALKLVAVAIGAAVLMFYHRQIREAIESFRNNFPRGGPPSPTHPSPAGDVELLRHRAAKKLD
jgi:hypothetical protein